MKVCVLTSVHPAFDDRIFHRECSSLARAGHDVTLIVPHERDEVVDGVRIKALPRPNGRLQRMTGAAYRLYREAVRQGGDIYHFHDPELLPLGLYLRFRGKKVIYDIHEDTPRDIQTRSYLPAWLRPPLGFVLERAENLASRYFSAVVPATPGIAARFNSRNPRCVVINNFPCLEEFLKQPGTPWKERESALAYLGTIGAGRGIRELMEAVALLPKHLQARLKLAGQMTPSGLKDELARHPAWPRVEWLGYLDRKGVADVLGQVRVGLVTLLPDPNTVSSQPVKLYEYMAAGLPVIASDFPLWRGIVDGAACGVLVDPRDPRAIARAIEYILTHAEEAEAMGRRGREAVEKKYNWAGEEAKLLELYASLLGNSCAA